MVIFLGITRIVTQSGVHFLTTPVTSQGMVLALTGTAVPPPTLMGLALTNVWCGDVQSIFMVSAAHAARLNTLCQRRRGLALAMGISVTVSFFTTSFFLLSLAYDLGALNLRSILNLSSGHGATVFNGVVAQMQQPVGTDWTRLLFFVLGATVYAVVAYLHYRVAWWPLHPVGLTIASTWMVRQIVLSVFIAWVSQDVDPAIWLGSTLRTPAPIFSSVCLSVSFSASASVGSSTSSGFSGSDTRFCTG